MAWTDIDPAEEPAFNEWYNHEHMRDRVLGVPGFLRGRRFVALSGEPKYLALYEAVGPEVFSSDSYLRLIGTPDPKSHHFILNFRQPIRTVARLVASFGESEGASLALLPLLRGADWRAARDRLVTSAIPALVGFRGIVAAQLIERDDEAASGSTRRHVRQGDRSLAAALLVESAEAEFSLADLSSRVGGVPQPDPDFVPSMFKLLYRVSPRPSGNQGRSA
ncbi:hypothetical protein [uncultured Enterovirga sp.]|uniref:hypothetical protein n=1 Tax=uncultured Enterovirga sp. TaxID=2026352 RepID=UPI0035C95E28